MTTLAHPNQTNNLRILFHVLIPHGTEHQTCTTRTFESYTTLVSSSSIVAQALVDVVATRVDGNGHSSGLPSLLAILPTVTD